MSVWKQILGVLLTAVVTVVLWALFVPSSHPFLDRYGLLGPLKAVGLVGDEVASGDGTVQGGPGGRNPVEVVAHPIEMQGLNDTVTSVGTAKGVRSVTLAAEIAGQVANVAVRSGQYVEAGALIVELNSEAAQIAVDKAEIIHNNELRNLERLKRLQASGSAADQQLQEAELAERSAALAVREAAYELSRHRILAPMAGWVGILEIETGDLVSPGTSIAALEDRSSLLVDFRVPERVANLLSMGDSLRASPVSSSNTVVEGRISALDNKLDEVSRTLRVQATIPNAEDLLRPGMAITLTLNIPGDKKPAVDPLAIQWGTDGAFVWLLRDGKAMRLPVNILERKSDAVLVDADFKEGDLVVSEGMTSLRPGAAAVSSEAADMTAPKPVTSNG